MKHNKINNIVNYAVKMGTIIKPDCCEKCGNETIKRNLHGHHYDYSKPLEVIWLCAKCHWELHNPNFLERYEFKKNAQGKMLGWFKKE